MQQGVLVRLIQLDASEATIEKGPIYGTYRLSGIQSMVLPNPSIEVLHTYHLSLQCSANSITLTTHHNTSPRPPPEFHNPLHNLPSPCHRRLMALLNRHKLNILRPQHLPCILLQFPPNNDRIVLTEHHQNLLLLNPR